MNTSKAVLFKNAMWKKKIRSIKSCCLICVHSRHYLMYRRMWCRFSILMVRRDESCIWVATIKSETYAVDICHHSYVLKFKKLIFVKLLCEWIHFTKTRPGSISPQNQLKIIHNQFENRRGSLFRAFWEENEAHFHPGSHHRKVFRLICCSSLYFS